MTVLLKFLLLIGASFCTKFHEPSYTRHEMIPRKKEEMSVAYTQDDLYFSEFESYVDETNNKLTQKWAKKYPLVKVASKYFPSIDRKLSKKTFKLFFLDAMLDYYLQLPFKLGLQSLRTIVNLYKTRIWHFYLDKPEFHEKALFNLTDAYK